MDKYCQYCGDELLAAHKGFGICAWCLKKVDEGQKRVDEFRAPSYFNVDREEYKDEIDYG